MLTPDPHSCILRFITAGHAAGFDDETNLVRLALSFAREQVMNDGLRGARLVPGVARLQRFGQHETGCGGSFLRVEHLRVVMRGDLFRVHLGILDFRFWILD